MKPTIPAHKVVGDDKPGQIVNPINTDMMDDMGGYASPRCSGKSTVATQYLNSTAPYHPSFSEPLSERQKFAARALAADIDLAVTHAFTCNPPIPKKYTPPSF